MLAPILNLEKMGRGAEQSHYVKQVTLPSGKRIDVVYFEDTGPTKSWGSKSLHICPACNSELVYPLNWSEVEAGLWAVTVRCPDCEDVRSGVFDQRTVEQFDRELDHGLDQLIGDLDHLERANMEEDIERFISALAGDKILPVDF